MAAVLPILYNLIPNPVLFRWYWAHNGTPVSHSVRIAASRADRIILFVAQGILLWITLGMSAWFRVPLTHAGFAADGAGPIGVGCMAGLGWLGFYAAVLFVAPPGSDRLMGRWDMRVSFQYWFALSISSSIVEELWRVFCLVSLASQGHSLAVTVSALAFGLAHYSPAGRALSTTLFAIWMALLFFAVQSLWALVVAHCVVNIGVYFLIRLKAGVDPFYVRRDDC